MVFRFRSALLLHTSQTYPEGTLLSNTLKRSTITPLNPKKPFFDFEPSDDFKTALAHPEKHVSGVQAVKILSGLLQQEFSSKLKVDADLTRGEAALLIYQLL